MRKSAMGSVCSPSLEVERETATGGTRGPKSTASSRGSTGTTTGRERSLPGAGQANGKITDAKEAQLHGNIG